MLFRWSLSAVFIFVTVFSVWAEELRWPLDIEISPSSSFMECRGMRFHGGIDLRTRKTNGFPVYAIADGFVSRIKIQHRGFGYALYVDHPHLKIRSVFGHLDEYAEPMAGYASRKLAKLGKRYGIDDQFGIEKFPVKRGQVIAYTGETGLGPPHLHFEIRNFQDDPISPTSLGYRLPDNITPEFTGIWVEPLKFGTTINGSFLPFRIELRKKSPKSYCWENPLVIAGEAGLAVGVLDRGEGDNRMSAAEIRIFLDEKERFSREFKTYSYDENRQAPYVYDAVRSSVPGLGYVAWLFKWPFENMMLSKEFAPWSGVLGSSSSGSRLKIFIKDFGGLEAVAEGPIRIAALPDMQNPKAPGLSQGRIEHAFSGMVLTCDLSSSSVVKDPLQVTDHCFVQTRDGVSEKVPAVEIGKRLQLQIPYLKKWEPGVFLQGIRLAGPFTYLDKSAQKFSVSPGLSLEIPSGAVNQPVLWESIFSPAPQKSKRLVPLSGVWAFKPERLITDLPMILTIELESALSALAPALRARVASLTITPRQYGLYNTSGSGEPRHMGGEVQAALLTYRARSLGEFGVFADLVPPAVSYSGSRVLKKLGACYVFKVSDVGEGVDFSSLEATVDGNSAEVDSDPDYDEVYVVKSGKKGKADVRLRVSDNAGNRTEARQKR